MTVTINYDTVKALKPTATDTQIALYEGLFDAAENCLSSYPQSVQDLTVGLAIAHMLQVSEGGSVTSETTRQGASASYSIMSGTGLAATQYGQQLLGLPSSGCITNLFAKPVRFAKSIKPCR